MMKQLHNLHFTGEIKKSSRLIQKNHRGFLCQRLCYHYFLTLTVTQSMYHPVFQILNPYQRNGIVYCILSPCLISPETGIRTAPHTHQFFHGHVPQTAFFGQYHSDNCRQLFIGVIRQFLSHYFYLSSYRRLKGRQSTQSK